MTTRIRIFALLLAGSVGLGLAMPVGAETAFIKNPSFENNLNTNTPPLLPTAPMGWPYYSSIDDWMSANGGVNDLVYDPSGPFHNAGTPVPDGRRIGFRQGGGSISQDITGLTAGLSYWVQFRYDRRAGGELDIAVKFSTVNQGGAMDQELAVIEKPRPATQGAPYAARTVAFTPDLDSGTLTFENRVAPGIDATMLLDAVTIVQRDEGNFPVMNPSFEASGVVFDGASSAGADWPAISGWTKAGVAGVEDGTGGVADNGAIPDQALAVFITGVGSLSQTLEPLVVDDNYQVQFAYNAKTGTTPHLQLKVGNTVIWEQDVTAVGGTAPYRTASASFKATAETAQIQFANTIDGATVLLDDVKVLGKTGTKLPPMGITPAKALVRVGEQIKGTVSIPGERLASGDAVIKLRVANGGGMTNVGVIELVGADASGTLSIPFGFSAGASAPPAGAKLWLKADAITGLAHGAKVANWADASGNANDASQAAEANQPTFAASGRNNLPTVRFDDLDADGIANGVQFLDSKATVQTKNPSSFTAIAVFRADDTGVTASALEGRDTLFQPLDVDTTANRGRTVLFLDTVSDIHKLQSVSAQAALVADRSYSPATWTMATVLQDASASTLSLFVNGTPDKAVPMGPEGGQNAAWRIGATKQGHGGLKGEIAEILVYDRALTPAERHQAESYLGKKWALPAATTQDYLVKATGVGNAAIQIADSAGLLLPSDLPAIFVAGSTFVLNPSFELDKDSGVATAAVTGWTTGGANIGMAAVGNPFLSALDPAIPDREKVLRVQGSGTVSQTINGLQPGRPYGLQFFYNRRSTGYDPSITLDLQVSFAGQVLADLPGLVPASEWGLTDYYFHEARFTPAATSGVIEFKTVASGDATLFLDAVSIVPRSTDEIAVMNSSFEGTAMGVGWPGYMPGRVAGWSFTGAGHGPNAYSPKTFFVEPFFDNGINSDQDNVFFMQGSGRLEQMIGGLAFGEPYTLVLDYNVRHGESAGGQGATGCEVYLDGAPVFTDASVLPANSQTPWLPQGFLHTLPMYQVFVPFTAASDPTALQINHVSPAGDHTLLVDNVRIVPGTRMPPTITKQLAAQTAKEGDTVTFTTAATGAPLSYRWLRDGVPLADGGAISGATTATLTLANVPLAAAGTYTVLVTDGLGVVGSAAALTVEPGVIVPPTIDKIEISGGNLVLTWTGTARLVIATDITLPMAQWQNAPGANTVSPYSIPVSQIPGNVIFARLVAQ